MENKINIAELLKDCPKGMELDCTMYDNLYFDSLNADYYNTVNCYTLIDGIKTSINFTKYGTFNNHSGAKCVIFPKGKTTWEGFVPPCQFKDGDIVATKLGSVFILKNSLLDSIYSCYVALNHESEFINKEQRFGHKYMCRLATEEEKQKLFDAIKDNGYKWNAETKTLEKLDEPKFKVGDEIKPMGSDRHYNIKNIKNDRYILNDNVFLKFTDEHHFELVPKKFDISDFKPFDKVLVRTDNKHVWSIQFFERINNRLKDSFVCMGGVRYRQCIPYEGNEHLLHTANECDNFFKVWGES